MCGEYAPPSDHDLRPNHERILPVDQAQVQDTLANMSAAVQQWLEGTR